MCVCVCVCVHACVLSVCVLSVCVCVILCKLVSVWCVCGIQCMFVVECMFCFVCSVGRQQHTTFADKLPCDVGVCVCMFVCFIYVHVKCSIQKWVLWILFYNIKVKSIYLPKH